jgi:hypothetical protein
MAINILAGSGTAVLSAAAFCVGWLAFRPIAAPRSLGRVLELGFLALPFMVVAGYVAVFALG